jgi:hypothetical protein
MAIRLLRILLPAALLALALAEPAAALGIGDVQLLRFPAGGANTGLTNPGLVPDFSTSPTTDRLCVGAGVFQATGVCAGHSSYQIRITQDLRTVHQFPQAQRSEPSAANPFIADSRWTATNTTDQVYPQVLLLFTSVNLLPYPGQIANGYPDLQVGLDGHLLDVVKYSASGVDYFFAAVDLGRLAPGESRSFTVRYIVGSGPMPIVNNQVVMPPLKLVGQVVPEPGTLALLFGGLAGIGFAGRRR